MKKTILLYCSIIICANLFAQKTERPEQIIGDLLESLSENDIDINNQSQFFDDLLDLYENPINLNTAKIEQLEKLIFLSDFQIINTIEYIKKLGPIYSKFQLQGVNGLKREDIERLMLFTKLESRDSPVKHRKYLNGQLLVRNQFDIENAKGFLSDTSKTGYLGNKHHLYSKFQAQYGQNIHAGFVLDKDAGEETFPIDFISGHVMFKGDKFLKTLIIGDYHANFGQGLAMWTGTSMGKTSEALNVRKRSKGFRKYTSANEYAFLRGVATTVEVKKIEFSVFASHKERDAEIIYDIDSTYSIATSLPESGYHRTTNEIDKRNNLGQTTLGANIAYRIKNLSVSAGGFYQKSDVDSIAIKELYQFPSHEETHNKQYWFGYDYGLSKLLLFGEIAFSDNGNPAFLNGIQFKPTNSVSIAMLYRWFSKNYFSPWMNAFSESSSPSGESGYYLGINAFPAPKVKLSGYIDIFNNKWLKYGIDKPSTGYDITFQADYNFNRSFKVYFRYKEKEKLKNQNIDQSPDYRVVEHNTKKARLHTDSKLNDNWKLQMRVEKSFYKEENLNSTDGMLAFAGLKYSSNNHKFACWLRHVVFDTENYETRLYAYENDLLYNFYTPSFQGEGSRTYFMIQYRPLHKINVWLKAGRTNYTDRDEISSGLQTIKGNTRTNIRMQIQIKF